MTSTVADAVKVLEILADPNNKQEMVPFLQGPPGIGKSQIVRQVADRLGYEYFLDIRLSQHDSTDIKGIPHLSDDGSLRWVPPEFMPLEGSKWDDGKPGVLFFDELNRATVEVLQSVFEAVHDRSIGMKPILDNWFIVAAGNFGYEDGTDVVEMDAALRNRFMMIPLASPTFVEWKDWAESAGVHQLVIDYLGEHEDQLYYSGNDHELVTPRTWEKVSKILSQYKGAESTVAELISRNLLFSLSPQFVQFIQDQSSVRVRDIMENYGAVEDRLNELDRHEILSLIDKVDQYVRNYPVDDINGFSQFFRNHLTEDNQVALIVRLYKSDAGMVVIEKFLKVNPDINTKNSSLFQRVKEAIQSE